jgi:glycerol-3-phosphate acyltransferase PlsY
VISIFSKGVAIAVLWFNILGDAVSAIVGQRYGRVKFFKGKKSLEGSISFLVICIIVGLLLCLSPRVDLTLSKIIVGAIVATIVEALPLPVDDNLTIPIGAGIVMELL